MRRLISPHCLIALVVVALFWPAGAGGTVIFDFDEIQGTSRKGIIGADIEIYMEGLYGSGLFVSPKARAVHGPDLSGLATLSGLASINSYVTAGKGKLITMDFGDNPIDSFSVDFKLFKKAKGFSILADGELVHFQKLTKAQSRRGLVGHQSAYFFDTPVHTLQFIGSKKKSFAIDNLVIDLPSENDDDPAGSDDDPSGSNDSIPDGNSDEPSGTGAIVTNEVGDVSEPASLMLVLIGALGLMTFRKNRARIFTIKRS